ncbi:MAG: hypothetical protein AMQ74_01793 [Candidatus Methanofastidiosum methylothiophilum]|uniref:Uncharacterized protein n=1 Tax=Candidatus Methanofastidiosum methylothiophilum TaxID=1705564 RepID=A0A150IPG1_9EURY|nr:MAG: hypothetical protein AMQ74_01793 [Candidatus Methanofastidiosum methylthiophilus]
MVLKLFGHKINVEFDSELEKNTGSYGMIELNNLICRIDSQLPKTMKLTAIFHEILETSNYMLELGLDHKQITAIASSFTAALLDNRILSDLISDARNSFDGTVKQEIKKINVEEKIDYTPFDHSLTSIIESIKKEKIDA